MIGQLVGSDVRKNYALIGALWTQTGTIPDQTGYTLEGSTDLANSTMETYHQDLNCFTCHSIGSTSTEGLDVSHIYDQIVPLQ